MVTDRKHNYNRCSDNSIENKGVPKKNEGQTVVCKTLGYFVHTIRRKEEYYFDTTVTLIL